MLYTIGRLFLIPFLWIYSGGRIKVRGKENLKAINNGCGIICCNHITLMDAVALVVIVNNRKINFMAKAELFTNKIYSWFFHQIGAFPVHRGAADISAVKEAIKILKQDKIFGIFPQGRINREELLIPFKDGISLIAHRSRAVVLPIVFTKKYGFLKRIEVVIGEPIYFDDYYDKHVNAQMLTEMTDIIYSKFEQAVKP